LRPTARFGVISYHHRFPIHHLCQGFLYDDKNKYRLTWPSAVLWGLACCRGLAAGGGMEFEGRIAVTPYNGNLLANWIGHVFFL
jgi:hypothetical protein